MMTWRVSACVGGSVPKHFVLWRDTTVYRVHLENDTRLTPNRQLKSGANDQQSESIQLFGKQCKTESNYLLNIRSLSTGNHGNVVCVLE